jgi:hypothetical protein
MADTAQDIKSVIASVAEFPPRPQVAVRAIFPLHGDFLSGRFGKHGADGVLPAGSESQSSQATRAALLTLDDCPTDAYALQVLWVENHLAFESHTQRHLNSPDRPALFKRVFSGVVSLSRFYCDEIDDPKAWVARCANLETRRVALQLAK